MTESCFNTIVKRDYPKYVFFASRYVSREDSEEIVDDAFLVVWKQLGSVNDESNAGKLIYTVIKNKCVDICRRKVKYIYPETLPDFYENDDTNIILTEFLSLLKDKIDCLSPKRKEVIKHVLDGKSNEEICAELNMTNTSVRESKSSAITFLRKIINPDHIF